MAVWCWCVIKQPANQQTSSCIWYVPVFLCSLNVDCLKLMSQCQTSTFFWAIAPFRFLAQLNVLFTYSSFRTHLTQCVWQHRPLAERPRLWFNFYWLNGHRKFCQYIKFMYTCFFLLTATAIQVGTSCVFDLSRSRDVWSCVRACFVRFLSSSDSNALGNYSLLDQVAVLRWI